MDKVQCNPNSVQVRYTLCYVNIGLCKNKLTLEESRKTFPICDTSFRKSNMCRLWANLPLCNQNSYGEPSGVLGRRDDISTCATHLNEPRNHRKHCRRRNHPNRQRINFA